ncbi:Xaa-Pro dipeptidase [Haliangium ochraceum]|uniref:Peptidase M24 n=1 Tax=Haliangium ochraceum (strain DSM 14365 / JCM 11303 / SMP-2) TaxID=502025 RepID=D0LHE1_HALO1|nr:Xaa-Pro dipeptidase [Haliangium ochraceum]ACY18286.1 peptidase M24 [Haliangium ochraceum DSM 14365]
MDDRSTDRDLRAATARLTDASLDDLYTEHLATLQDAYGAALEEQGFDAVLIHAGTPAKRHEFDDAYWPLCPTPAFTHWVPWHKDDAALLIQPGKRPRLIFSDPDDFWHSAAAPESEHFWGGFDEVELDDAAAVDAGIGRELRSSDRADARMRAAFIGADGDRARAWGFAEETVNPAGLTAALERVRVRKTAYELRCLGEASRRAAIGHQAVHEAFLADEAFSEFDLHLRYLAATGQDDAETPYKNIVALDENAAVLHHLRYTRERARTKNRSLLIDAGATYLGYASDITRTYVKGSGRVVEVFGALIAAVESLQAEVCARIQPGLAYEALHDQSHELLAEQLRTLEISDASVEELLESGATRVFLPHGLGHSLGIQVHDVGCRLSPPRPENRYLRNTSVIEAGQVFTIEPGCYFIESLLADLRKRPVAERIDWELVAELSAFGGVRIEDNLAVLERGTLNLTRDNWPSAP